MRQDLFLFQCIKALHYKMLLQVILKLPGIHFDSDNHIAF